MKKIIFVILIFLFPIFVRADYSIENYRIDVTVLENGDVNVVETFSMGGIYNGYEKTISYKDNYNNYYGSNLVSVDDINIYDAKDIKLNEIRSIDFSFEKELNDILVNSYLFEKSNHAKKGEYGVYTTKNLELGEVYTIYNPSKMNKDFYIDYTLTNVAVVHEDISEVSMFLFKNLDKNINLLQIYINVPNNKNFIKAYIHSDFEYEYEIINNNSIKLTIENFNKSSLDFRVLFDKDSIVDAKKKTLDKVLDKIIDIEDKVTYEIDETNLEYELLKEKAYNLVSVALNNLTKEDFERALAAVNELNDDEYKNNLLVKLINLKSKIERKYIMTKVIYTSVMGIIILGLFVILYKTFKTNSKVKKEKDFSSIFKYSPAIVGYLMKRKIDNKDLTATVINLINNKNIVLEKTKNKKDYKFIKLSVDNLGTSDERLIKLIFDNNNEITFSKFVKLAKENYKGFIIQYSNWHNSVIQEASLEKFYKDLLFVKVFGISYSIIGIIISALFLDESTYFSPIITIIVCIIFILYFCLFYKRTEKGKNEYYKCVELKKQLNNIDINSEDFIKYMTYSIPLNCYNKVLKTKSIIINDFNENYIIVSNLFKNALSIAYLEKKL